MKQSEVIMPKSQGHYANLHKRFSDGCKLIDVHLHGHLIIAGNEITSLADMGLMRSFVLSLP